MFCVFMNTTQCITYIIIVMFFVDAVNLKKGSVVAAPETALPVFSNTLQIGYVVIKQFKLVILPVEQIQTAFIGSAGPKPVFCILIQQPYIVFFFAGYRI